MLVEDEVLVAALAVDALEELGYQTFEVDDRQGCAGIVSGTSTLAVRDRRRRPAGWTRRRAGARSCAQLRAGLPIIIATGYGGAPLIKRCASEQRTAVLNKPYDIAQLQAAIQAASCGP